jgi:hypothetical protein
VATEPGVTERCLLCRRELPRGGFSARVAGILLSPLCVDCERRCSANPDSVVAEHPRLFERPEAKETYVPDSASVAEAGPPIRNDRPTVVTQPASYSSAPSFTLQQVIVTDIHMPFGSMVGFMVKWSIAAIPAIIILFLLGLVASALFGVVLWPFFQGVMGIRM